MINAISTRYIIRKFTEGDHAVFDSRTHRKPTAICSTQVNAALVVRALNLLDDLEKSDRNPDEIK